MNKEATNNVIFQDGKAGKSKVENDLQKAPIINWIYKTKSLCFLSLRHSQLCLKSIWTQLFETVESTLGTVRAEILGKLIACPWTGILSCRSSMSMFFRAT